MSRGLQQRDAQRVPGASHPTAKHRLPPVRRTTLVPWPSLLTNTTEVMSAELEQSTSAGAHTLYGAARTIPEAGQRGLSPPALSLGTGGQARRERERTRRCAPSLPTIVLVHIYDARSNSACFCIHWYMNA